MAGFKPGPFQCYYPSQRRLLAKNNNVAKESVPRNSEKNDLYELLFSIALLTPSLHAKTHSRLSHALQVFCPLQTQGVRRNRFSDVPKGSWGIDTYKR